MDHRYQLLGLIPGDFSPSILKVEADRLACPLVGAVTALAAFVHEAQPFRDLTGVSNLTSLGLLQIALISLARRLMM